MKKAKFYYFYLFKEDIPQEDYILRSLLQKQVGDLYDKFYKKKFFRITWKNMFVFLIC